ncbi:MAG: ABC transporter permease [Dehalococcoidia bacterium]
MSAIRDFFLLTRLNLLMSREIIWFIGMVQAAFSIGLVLGFGYLIPNIGPETALYFTTGAATQAIILVGLVSAPQTLAQAKAEGRLDYFRSLPINREAYFLSILTTVFVQAVPGIIFALALGAWKYDLSFSVDPLIVPVVFLAVMSLAGVGVGLAVLSPHMQLTNAITQLVIFYALFFAPVLVPAEQLPLVLREVANWLPPTYAADGVRATLTDLPNRGLGKDMAVMSAFAIASIAAASFAMRRRG